MVIKGRGACDTKVGHGDGRVLVGGVDKVKVAHIWTDRLDRSPLHDLL